MVLVQVFSVYIASNDLVNVSEVTFYAVVTMEPSSLTTITTKAITVAADIIEIEIRNQHKSTKLHTDITYGSDTREVNAELVTSSMPGSNVEAAILSVDHNSYHLYDLLQLTIDGRVDQTAVWHIILPFILVIAAVAVIFSAAYCYRKKRCQQRYIQQSSTPDDPGVQNRERVIGNHSMLFGCLRPTKTHQVSEIYPEDSRPSLMLPSSAGSSYNMDETDQRHASSLTTPILSVVSSSYPSQCHDEPLPRLHDPPPQLHDKYSLSFQQNYVAAHTLNSPTQWEDLSVPLLYRSEALLQSPSGHHGNQSMFYSHYDNRTQSSGNPDNSQMQFFGTEHVKQPSSSTSLHSNQSPQRTAGGGINPRNSPVLTFAVILAVSLVSVVTYSTQTDDQLSSRLTVKVPPSVKIRNIRSYSDEDVDLASISLPPLTKTTVTFYNSLDCDNDELKSCKAFASCDTLRGSYQCRCRTGYFVSAGRCEECTRTCPDGHYMVTPCTTSTDVICQQCRVCNGSTYEVAACSTTQDRVCLDVTFPARGELTNNTSLYTKTVSFSSSYNVFIEKLGGIKSLEEPMYTKNQGQKLDFVWLRESGLEVAVKIRNVFLVPQYQDLDQKGDNIFIQSSHRTTESEKNALKKAMTFYCRNPVPDEYHLGLTIIGDRTTSVKVVRCNSFNASIPACPAGYKNGDTYYQRDLNKNCPYVQSAQPLGQFANNIMCTDDSPLLDKVFTIGGRPIRKRFFPSAECENAKNNCIHCVRQEEASCTLSWSQCCVSRCHTQPHCLLYYSQTCPKLTAQCATGDVYEFTLEANTRSLSNKFHCYLERIKTQNLYEIEYTVSLPSINYRFPTRQRNVTYSSKEFNLRANFSVDFFHLSHNAYITVPDEIMAVGDYHKTKIVNIGLHPLISPNTDQYAIFDLKNPKEISFNVRIQFDKPFRYSTSSWRQDGCYKNISHILPARPLFLNKSIDVVAHISKLGDAFHYQMYPEKKIPFIRLKLPENASVLSWYKDLSPSPVIDGDNLSASLESGQGTGHWIVNITGNLLTCPAYLRVTLRDQCLSVIIDKYDVFVNCPRQFHISLTVVNIKSTAAIFTVSIEDNHNTYNLFLSAIRQPQYLQIKHNLRNTLPDQSPWRPVTAMLVATFLVVILIIFFTICLDKRSKDSGKRTVEIGDAANATYLSAREMEHLNTKPSIKPLRKTPISKVLLVIFIALYLIYALLFTCTVTCGLLYFIVNTNSPAISNINLIKKHIEGNFTEEMKRMSQYTDAEINRVFQLVRNRVSACGHHLEHELNRVSGEIRNYSEINAKNKTSDLHSLKNSLMAIVAGNSREYNATMNKFIHKFQDEIRRKLETVRLDYRDYLLLITKNPWMKLPRMVYRKQLRNDGIRGVNVPAGFVEWLGVESVVEVESAYNDLINRLESPIPYLQDTNFIIPTDSPTMNWDTVPIRNRYYTDHLLKFTSMKMSESNHNSEKNTLGVTRETKYFTDEIPQNQTAVKHQRADKMQQLFVVLIICCIVFDIVLFFNRLKWLEVNVKSLLHGFEQKVPLDGIASKLQRYQPVDSWTASFHEPISEQFSEIIPLEKGINSLSQTEMHFLPQNVPKAKENIIQEVFDRRKLKRVTGNKGNQSIYSYYIRDLFHQIMEFACSRATWKVVILVLILWVLCILTHCIDIYMTLESAHYVFGMGLLLPQLRDHTELTNTIIHHYTTHVNQRIEKISHTVDNEVASINGIIEKIIVDQTKVWSQLSSNACHALSNATSCTYHSHNVPSLTTSVLSCNLLPVSALPYLSASSYKRPFTERVSSELEPVIDELRSRAFSIVYLITGFICIGVLIHILAAILLRVFLRHDIIPISMVYQATHGASNLSCSRANVTNDSDDQIHVESRADTGVLQRESNL